MAMGRGIEDGTFNEEVAFSGKKYRKIRLVC